VFENQSYITKGVSSEIPFWIQMVLWVMIDSMEVPKDWLHVFRVRGEKDKLHITHTQEEPPYSKKVTLPLNGERILIENDVGDDDIYLCQICHNPNYTTCSECGRILHLNNAYYDDDDEPLCYNCHATCDDSRRLHGYSYRPDSIFYGGGNRYLGVELEIDRGGKSFCNAQKICDVANGEEKQIYIKTDGSLDEGLEIVTHRELSVMSWHGFLERLTQPELITYLKERRLYVEV